MTRNQKQKKKSPPSVKLGFPPLYELYQIPGEQGQANWEEMGHHLRQIHSELTQSGQLFRNRRISKRNQNR